MNTAERAARRYYRKVRSWLPGGKMRRYVMTQIRETVQEFVQEHPDADVAAIQHSWERHRRSRQRMWKIWKLQRF